MDPEQLTIDRSTTIQQLLNEKHDEVVGVLVKLNKNFGRLKNPLLRKVFARRVTIADACRIAGCSIPDFFRSMQSIGFRIASATSDESPSDRAVPFTEPASEDVITFDVRPVLERGNDPLKQILQKTTEMTEGKVLKIINTFEPLPLISLLSKKGFTAKTQIVRPDEIITWFYRADRQTATAEISPENELYTPEETFDEQVLLYKGQLREIDVRKLDMPGPMITVLDTLETLKEGEALFVHHKKVPVYLLPHLQDKGYRHLIWEQDEHNVKLLIYRQ